MALDFMKASYRLTKKGDIEVYPKFLLTTRTDLMTRGGDFYAIWDENKKLWSMEETDAIRLIDNDLDEYVATHQDIVGTHPKIMYMFDSESGEIDIFHHYCQKQLREKFVPLDDSLVFSNTELKKDVYASKVLPYALCDGSIEAYDKLISTLYIPAERHKIEWSIGAIVSGDSRYIQKFIVLYGSSGTGKSTILNIIQSLFQGYYSVFDARALGSASNSFALEAFKSNPLVAIQHDGDLSRIEDNTRLNSLVSHEMMTVNEKFKSTYSNQFKAFLYMGTNKPVKITDAKSGLIRRLIDVSPSGNLVSRTDYTRLTHQIKFELGAIAQHCLNVYLENPGYYDDYVPTNMMGASNDFYNFIEDSYDVFRENDETCLDAAWAMYQTYCTASNMQFPFNKRVFKEELKNYFREYSDRHTNKDGTRVRSYYYGFKKEIFDGEPEKIRVNGTVNESDGWLKFDHINSLFDIQFQDCPAQYANDDDKPTYKWDNVTRTLKDISTDRVHYVKVPVWLIVIDFDIPDDDGNKSFEKNLEAASKWPSTYAELSKSGKGIHLHYIYKGDPTKLSCIYDDHVEIKVFAGGSSLRRKLTKCNGIPIKEISTGLPLKEGKPVVSSDTIFNEKALRTTLIRAMNKEYNGGTKDSVEFIKKILDDAYAKGTKYDLTPYRPAVMAFASNSTNHSSYCLSLVPQMHFSSEDAPQPTENYETPIIFFDCEVFPNLFVLCWKLQGEENPVVSMINPKPSQIAALLKYNLVGFNNRKYDNHIVYAAMMGYNNEQIYSLSKRLIETEVKRVTDGKANCYFSAAYNLSYTDIYDYSSKKQSLKKWEIQLGIHHQELGLRWDEPVAEELWNKVADYCKNDVTATEAVWNATQGDWLARCILAEIANGTRNDTTNTLTRKLIFGDVKNPALVYTNLKTGERTDGGKDIAFPDYEMVIDEQGKVHNIFRDEELGRGGYVWAKPGMYWNVWTFDVRSQHPNSAIQLNAFGEYTKNFEDIVNARANIKHKDFKACETLFNGKLQKFLADTSKAKQLSGALKIAINAVYGLTSASFENAFKDERNVNNIVALRGALFMCTLKKTLIEMGVECIHCKTDSIKIVNPTEEIYNFIMNFGKKYGYDFEIEHKFEKICLVNDAVYIGKLAKDDPEEPGAWTATGTQFAVPYVFKKLFTKDKIVFKDVCETKSVKSAIYLDMNENLPETEHNYMFIGKVGLFCPIKEGFGGGLLVREMTKSDGTVKYDSVTGTKNFRWLEAEFVSDHDMEDAIDTTYYDILVDKAKDEISKYGDFEIFAGELEQDGKIIYIDDEEEGLAA